MLLCHSQLQGNQSARIDALWDRIQEGYRALKVECRLSTLTIGMIATGPGLHTNFPCLSASAAETRDLLQVLPRLVQELRGEDRDLWDRILVCSNHILRMQHLIREARTKPTAREAAAFEASTKLFLLQYAHLSAILADRNILGFNVIPKAHQLWHAGLFFKFLNPSYHWAYAWENWVGRMARIARSCTAGVPLMRAGPHMLEKYIQLLTLRLMRRRDV